MHTITSLTGFEALLRGKKVCCYGLPFYAGWGLTEDTLPIPRRSRKLELWQLITGTLVYYPEYVHPEARCMINVETALNILKQQKNKCNNAAIIRRSITDKQKEKIRQFYLSLK